MALRPLSPLNDFLRQVLLEIVDPTTGVVTAVTTGTVTGFLATSKLPTATAYDPTWSVSGVYIGGANGFTAGTWQFEIDAAVLTTALCDAAFTTGTPYFIVSRVNAVRVYEQLRYLQSAPAVIA